MGLTVVPCLLEGFREYRGFVGRKDSFRRHLIQPLAIEMFLPSLLAITGLHFLLLPVRSDALLAFSENSVFQITLGVSVPVAMGKKGSIVTSWGFQMNFVLPSNVTQVGPTVISARKNRQVDLCDAYTAIEDSLNRHGWRDGKECLLRSICDLAEVPLDRTDQDVLREVIHLILTPSEDFPESFDASHRTVGKSYEEAQRLGSSVGNCDLLYPDCTESPLQSFTMISLPRETAEP